MTDRTYPRPAVELDALIDALYEAGANSGTVGTGNPDMIEISIEGAPAEEIDAIWEKATARNEWPLSRAEQIAFIKGSRARRAAQQERMKNDPELAASLKRAFDDARFNRAFTMARGTVPDDIDIGIDDEDRD